MTNIDHSCPGAQSRHWSVSLVVGAQGYCWGGGGMTADVPGWERWLIQGLLKRKLLKTTFGLEWGLTSSFVST